MKLFLLIVMSILSCAGKENLRWGILSTARINAPIIDAIRKSEHSVVVAVASRSQEKAEHYAQQWSIPKAYASYEQLLADPEVDVIYNSLPNALHAEWNIKALNAGKHVLGEKPFVVTLEEMDAVEQAAEKNNTIIFEAFGYFHHPQTQKVLSLVKEGKLGDIRYMYGRFSYPLPPEHMHNFRLHKTLGGGCLWDIGCYPISLAVALAHDQQPLRVASSIVLGETDVDIFSASQLHFDNNFTAHIFCSFRAPFAEEFVIVGTKGSIKTHHAWRVGARTGPTTLLFTALNGDEEIITLEPRHRYLDEIEAMERCIMFHEKPIVSLQLSRSIVATIQTLLTSAQ